MTAVLRALGAPLASPGDIQPALRERRVNRWQGLIEPVLIAWDTGPFQTAVRLPPAAARARLRGRMTLESGECRQWEWPADLPARKKTTVEGIKYTVKLLTAPGRLPPGYHRFTLEAGGLAAQALVIAAPLQACLPPAKRDWGVFLPLYALRAARSRGAADYADWAELMAWLRDKGGHCLATLPLLPVYLDSLFEPSPYLPASRLFWNEFFISLDRVPETARCPSAGDLLAALSPDFEKLANAPLVDYKKGMALKRRALEELCHCCFDTPERLEALQRFARARPEVDDYARFRAAAEKQGAPWGRWPERLRQGELKEGDFDEDARRYHLYAQWLAHEQVEGMTAAFREKGMKLYLDLPIGIHADGYDVWREQKTFLLDLRAGAPPDAVFPAGQDWLFPPPHPERSREQDYRYVIAYLRHHLGHADIMRLDHVMSLHRLFVIPRGMGPADGLYLRYPSEELYAIIALESTRAQAMIVGEDLGTVPPEVKPAMRRHGLNHMYVLHYELAAAPAKVKAPTTNSVASLNTHDMPPFAAFWRGDDIGQWLKLGMLGETRARAEREQRERVKKMLAGVLREKGRALPGGDARSALLACLSFLAASHARLVLVNLEDLWGETDPQNIPGTRDEYPNWRRKARHSLEELSQMSKVLEALRQIERLRKEKP
ncbi:MAG: 4-alpha-glucanotransferase [Chloroflexi bacterium]|nr:4-alpha-glucanotransferase [Chloroflexota bacterium]